MSYIIDAPTYAHGYVTGRYLTAVADGPDSDRLMDFAPAKGSVVFTPETVFRRNEGPAPALVIQNPVTCRLDTQGYITSPGGGRGVHLIAGTYAVWFDIEGAQVPGPKRIEVKVSHTEGSPLDLVLSMPDVVPPGSVVVVDETTAQRAEAAAERAESVVADIESKVGDAALYSTEAAAAADRAESAADSMEAAVNEVVSQSPADSAVAAVIGQEGTQARATVMGVASHVTATSAAGHTALSEARAATTSDLYARLRLTPDGRTRTTLFTGQPGPLYAVPTHTRTEDRVRVMEGEMAQRVTAASAGTLSISTSYDPPKTFPPASIVRALVWLDDAAAVSSLSVNIRQQVSPTVVQWSRSHVSAGHTLTNGWNLISWVASSGITTAWGQCVRVEVVASTTAATSITVQSVWVESPPKAQILFIEDRGYKTFVDRGLPDLRARGIPVTWALDPMLNGSNVGTKAEAITDDQVAQFYAAGDDMSIHAYAGERTALMSREQIRQDTLLSHQWLQDRGYVRGRQWRAAWTQNDAPHHAAARPYYVAYASPNSGASLTAWPFPDPWNVPRVNLQGSNSSRIDEFFQTLQRTNGLMVCYTHGIHEDGGSDMTPAQWAYLMQKIDAAKSEGWLEGVTFSQLLERSSGLMR